MFTLPDLPYPYDALEPYIDTATMKLHHDKHHATYVEKLNTALENHPDLQKKSIDELLGNIEDVPLDIRQAVVNHGGGHINHSFFWKIMSSKSAKAPRGELLDAINKSFKNFEEFKKAFTEKALGVFGSGWAFLILTPEKKLILKRHSFQNSPVMQKSVPILGIDVWEHAYYLKYQNRRAEYIEAWWNIIDWDYVSEIFAKSSA